MSACNQPLSSSFLACSEIQNPKLELQGEPCRALRTCTACTAHCVDVCVSNHMRWGAGLQIVRVSCLSADNSAPHRATPRWTCTNATDFTGLQNTQHGDHVWPCSNARGPTLVMQMQLLHEATRQVFRVHLPNINSVYPPPPMSIAPPGTSVPPTPPGGGGGHHTTVT